ncbi:hypothetical protein PAAG_00308 [Paracoccidioides lutzii Pb01]|uniref:Uncharacterized protein n=1 Tax=Paracoccidioides lutzii (strain ATCC MYA-826 / Pb01) TaxID=502779 RepID=C1GP63_PARBA|nr:hypothetical protein PAAG_00308 [Paracoccidioides lutzii Pb01]EEH35985.2 hypothetical protein PAAG_00308 [Paracoccidioides lutzii Pb01]
MLARAMKEKENDESKTKRLAIQSIYTEPPRNELTSADLSAERPVKAVCVDSVEKGSELFGGLDCWSGQGGCRQEPALNNGTHNPIMDS